MHAYRIGSATYPLFDGSGAATSDDARWNGSGRDVIYAAEHYATALVEKLAQVNSIRIPRILVYIRIDIPQDVTIEELNVGDLRGWDSGDKKTSRSFGNRWYDEGRSLILVVPSLAAPGVERNVLINQRHSEFRRLTSSAPAQVLCHPKLLV